MNINPRNFCLPLCVVLWLHSTHSVAVEKSDAEPTEAVVVQVDVRPASVASERCVVLIHGLARTAASMAKLARRLNDAGWDTVAIDYPSRYFEIEDLAEPVVGHGVAACRELGASRIDAVTHSLGGILMRYYLEHHSIDEFGRAVFLAPPNHGSEVVDNLGDVPGFVAFNGPAVLQLSTASTSIPNVLGPIKEDVGIIAGTTSINLMLSNFLPNPDDGKVSVASARLDGMCGFLTLPVSHPFLMKDKLAIKHIEAYLTDGKFAPDNENTPEYPACGHAFDE